MLNLALDTATRWGRFALAERDRLLAYRPVNVSGNYADALLPVIDQMLTGAGRRLEEVTAIGVTTGPGSFTGVRIGVATAKGLAYGLGARLVAESTLAAMAAALLADQPDRELAVPVMDARRGELFAAIYRRRAGWVEPVIGPSSKSPTVWFETVRQAVPDLEAPVYGGEGLGLLVGQGAGLRPELLSTGHPVQRSWLAGQPATARSLALAMGQPDSGLAEVHPFNLTPLYLRASDAEVKKRIDLTPRKPRLPADDFPPHGGESG